MCVAWVLVCCTMGCSVNNSRMNMYLTTDQMQRAIDERFCAGMSVEAVVEQVEADELVYFVIGDDSNQEVEARLLRPGLSRQTNPEFGRLLFGFESGGLTSAVYGTPIDNGNRWDYTRYRLEDCDETSLRVESGAAP